MKIKTITMVLLAGLFTLTATAKKKEKKTDEPVQKAYLFGFATTFNSETVYFTSIQEVDSAFIMKSGFLYGRDQYAYQLREHMAKEGLPNAISAISFAKTKEKAEKKYAKFTKRYTHPKQKKKQPTRLFDVRFISADDFSFTPFPATDEVLKKDAVWKAEQKELRKQAKAEAKANKQKIKDAKAERKAANNAAIREQKQRHREERKNAR